MSARIDARTAEKLLKVLFRINALILCSAILTIFLPNKTMDWIHQLLGMGALPGDPVTEYLARSCSMLYAVHGVVLLYVSMDLRRFADAVPLLIIVHLVLGVTILGIDLKAGMPWFWTAAEGPGIIAFAGVLYWLWKKTDLHS